MLYADLTIFFVNVVQIVAHFHIKYREKVYIFGAVISLRFTSEKIYAIIRPAKEHCYNDTSHPFDTNT